MQRKWSLGAAALAAAAAFALAGCSGGAPKSAAPHFTDAQIRQVRDFQCSLVHAVIAGKLPREAMIMDNGGNPDSMTSREKAKFGFSQRQANAIEGLIGALQGEHKLPDCSAPK